MMMNLLYNILLLSVFWAGIGGFTRGEPVKNCPQSCNCTLHLPPHQYRLTITDCVTEPGPELYILLQEHKGIEALLIINSSLSSVGDISYLHKLTELDLSDNHLTSCELSELPNLTDLRLKGNDIQSLDCDLTRLEKLSYLDLDNNKLKSVPCLLSKLTNLWLLTIANNDIREIDCDMSMLNKLDSLYLNYNRLKSVPCQLSKLPIITELYLSHNDIESVDCDISAMVGLEALSLDHNKLNSLPCELSNLPSLTDFELSHNNITTIDCDLSHLKKLDTVYLSYNKLTTVPCQLSKLPKLYELYLSYNDIQTLDCNLTHWDQLQHLYLDYNHLTSFPCDLPESLWDIGLSHNDIQSVDCSATQLHGVDSLSLNNNKIEIMPCELLKMTGSGSFGVDLSHNSIKNLDCNMSQVRISGRLDLSYNKLTTLPLLLGMERVIATNNAIMRFTKIASIKSNCEYLPWFDLWSNNISHLMDIFIGWDLPTDNETDFRACVDKLTQSFSGNPLVCDCIDYRFYKYLQSIGKNWSGRCSIPINLKGQNPVSIPLDQFQCNVIERCPEGCLCNRVPDNHALQVSCNKYTGIVPPQNLPFLETGNFYELDLQASRLTTLPIREYFPNISKAVFSDSFITEIPMATLRALGKNIKELDLSHNKLQLLPGEINTIEFKHLVEISLDDNPWNCSDCQLLGLREFITRNFGLIKNADLIRCHSPPEASNRKVLEVDIITLCQKTGGNDIFSITAIATTGSILLVASVTICIIKHRKVKEGVPVNVHRRGNGEDMDDIEDEEKVFDIFVSYATEDEDYAGEWLIPELERRGFKVCFHRVHFLGGVSILVNMYECINKSKHILAFFSRNFLDSNYCMYEFDLALSLDIDGGTKKLVTIKEATLDVDTLEPSYNSYFRTHTYIEQGAANFWENVLETMPKKKLGVVAVPDVNQPGV